MKKVFLIGLGVITSFLAAAQTKSYVGIKGGYQTGSTYIYHRFYSRSLIIREQYIQGMNLGLVYKFFSEKKGKLNTGIQTGLNYSQKGWQQDFDSVEDQVVTRMNYLELPVGAIIYAGNDKNRFYITISAYAEFLVSHQSPSKPNGLAENEDFFTYEPARDNEFGYGLKGSGGFQKDFGFGAILIEGFFSYSLSSVIQPDRVSDFVPHLSQHYNIGFSIGYLLPL